MVEMGSSSQPAASRTIEQCINEYLWHGYLPPRELPEWLWKGLQPAREGTYSIGEAATCVDNLFDRLCSRFKGPHLVPISGGWDSRLILAALVERLSTSEIETVSFGCPGQLDFDLGREIARSAGVRHHALNLGEVELEWSALVDSVRTSPWTYVPDGYFNALARKSVATSGTVWSGFMGDPLTGGHFKAGNPTASQAVEMFRTWQRRSRDLPLSATGFVPAYPEMPDTTDLPYRRTELLDFGIRQVGCIAPIVLPGHSWTKWSVEQGSEETGAQIVAPFCDPGWASFWIRAPRHLHVGQRLFIETCRHKYSRLFSLPSKHTLGFNPSAHVRKRLYAVQLRLRARLQKKLPKLQLASRALLNYIDFQWAFRARGDYVDLIEQAVRTLENHGAVPWLDLRSIWREHRTHRKDRSDALLLLLGLALNLEARVPYR